MVRNLAPYSLHQSLAPTSTRPHRSDDSSHHCPALERHSQGVGVHPLSITPHPSNNLSCLATIYRQLGWRGLVTNPLPVAKPGALSFRFDDYCWTSKHCRYRVRISTTLRCRTIECSPEIVPGCTNYKVPLKSLGHSVTWYSQSSVAIRCINPYCFISNPGQLPWRRTFNPRMSPRLKPDPHGSQTSTLSP